jgi:hypothetical protein
MEPRGCNRSQHQRGERQDPKKPHRYAVRPARRTSRKRVLHTCHAGGPFRASPSGQHESHDALQRQTCPLTLDQSYALHELETHSRLRS